MKSEMDTVLKRALHYVECYDLMAPTSGANWVAEELRQEIERHPITVSLSAEAAAELDQLLNLGIRKVCANQPRLMKRGITFRREMRNVVLDKIRYEELPDYWKRVAQVVGRAPQESPL